MNAYRDQYAQTFNGGKGVTVLAISVDADTVHAAWAKEAGYPVTFVSDTAKSLGAPYAVLPAGRSAYSRVAFVVGKDGRIAKVMVSADGGKSWAEADLQQPVRTLALVRFRMPWKWEGQPAILQSRATDETGMTQPTRAALVAERGMRGADGLFDVR